jgi:hypothetical protein
LFIALAALPVQGKARSRRARLGSTAKPDSAPPARAGLYKQYGLDVTWCFRGNDRDQCACDQGWAFGAFGASSSVLARLGLDTVLIATATPGALLSGDQKILKTPT